MDCSFQGILQVSSFGDLGCPQLIVGSRFGNATVIGRLVLQGDAKILMGRGTGQPGGMNIHDARPSGPPAAIVEEDG